MFKIAVMISGGGSNLQSLIDGIKSDYLHCSIEAVISDRDGVYGLERAKLNDIKNYVVDRKWDKDRFSSELIKILKGKVDLIVLAGYLSILSEEIITEFKNRIINIHPSLIPSFCGKGMYGIKVHEAAISYGVKYSGCTVHFVDEGTDTGAIILQKIVEVAGEDTAKSLQEKILVKEHLALPEAVKLISENKLIIHGRQVIIK